MQKCKWELRYEWVEGRYEWHVSFGVSMSMGGG